MKTFRTTITWLAFLVCQLGLILQCQSQTICNSNPTYRQPDNADMTVTCGTKSMKLSILLCPVYFGGYNESLMALNAMFSKPECRGVADWSVDPPVLNFNLSITESAIAVCGSKFKISNEIGTGVFSDFSNVQTVNISGAINSLDPSAGTITYRQQIMYMFSCRYPMQYLVNNTQVGVSGVSLALKDNNGSFISTLSMDLYSDYLYLNRLIVPERGLNLKTRIFVGVKATNLTERFNVLLDRCYATTSPLPINSTFYDLFVGCTRDGQTVVDVNGQSQMARFSFEAFRFVEHKNRTVSTFYLHCVTRLCEVSSCANFQPNCSTRAKREIPSSDLSANNIATVISPPIMVAKMDTGLVPETSLHSASSRRSCSSSPLVGVTVTFATLCVVSLALW